VPRSAKETDPGQWWASEEIGRHPRRAIPVPRKGHGRQGQGQGNVARGAPKGQTFWKRHWTLQECNNLVFSQNSKNECQHIVEEPDPSETERETAHGVKAMDVEALTTVGTFACTSRRKMMVDKLGPTGTL
jgi:hypothetical protein